MTIIKQQMNDNSGQFNDTTMNDNNNQQRSRDLNDLNDNNENNGQMSGHNNLHGHHQIILEKSSTESIDSTTTTTIDSILENYHQNYKERMIEFIYEKPHLPPTMFELKHKHKQIKQDIMEMFVKHLSNENLCSSQNNHDNNLKNLSEKIDKTFENSIMELSSKEYRICQTGFIIGWKDDKIKVNIDKQNDDNNEQQQQLNNNQKIFNTSIIDDNLKLSDYQIINDRF